MGKQRRERRKKQREDSSHIAYLSNLLGSFYEFLSGYSSTTILGEELDKNEKGTYKPTDEQVKAEFNALNSKWVSYCHLHHLMNASQLFMMNVSKAWERNKTKAEK